MQISNSAHFSMNLTKTESQKVSAAVIQEIKDLTNQVACFFETVRDQLSTQQPTLRI